MGAVSYLNSLPLIMGLDQCLSKPLVLDVPGKLFAKLDAGRLDVALCPVVDLITSDDYALVPCGGIGCAGPTLTVRLFSRLPIDKVDTVWADTDSHTSVALLKVLWRERFKRSLDVLPFDADTDPLDQVSAVLLIGDKVVTDAPVQSVFEYELDLGQAWHEWTGLPFVFAVWVCRKDAALGDLPLMMHECLNANLADVVNLAETHAPDRGWPVELAIRYLSQVLEYRITDASLAGIEHFAKIGGQLGLWPPSAELPVWGGGRALKAAVPGHG